MNPHVSQDRQPPQGSKIVRQAGSNLGVSIREKKHFLGGGHFETIKRVPYMVQYQWYIVKKKQKSKLQHDPSINIP